ncbi:MAG: hypothetical protein ABGY96_25635 [bacterium]|nr:hypothetical protein [Gammaproteobacteria bacterium]HIL97636.1 hypothetical protein [Pseudomonadales bacterium]
MKKLPLLILLFSLAGYVHADVASDLVNPDLTMEQVIQNGLDAGLTIEEIVRIAIQVDASQTAAIIMAAVITNPAAAPEITTVAINAGADATTVVQAAVFVVPAAAPEIATAAVNAGADSSIVLNAAVAAAPAQTTEITNAVTTIDPMATLDTGTQLATNESGGGTIPASLYDTDIDLVEDFETIGSES